jgi:hypothetical protein
LFIVFAIKMCLFCFCPRLCSRHSPPSCIHTPYKRNSIYYLDGANADWELGASAL